MKITRFVMLLVIDALASVLLGWGLMTIVGHDPAILIGAAVGMTLMYATLGLDSLIAAINSTWEEED
jgi:hypothetical protein